MLYALLLAAPAQACPTIATGTPSALNFDVAQVAIVRQGNRTTFSVSINPFGDKQGFALVLPVPEVLTEDEIQTLDADIFPTLDAYSAPRHVADAGCARSYDSDADADSDSDSDPDGSVDIEAQYLVGEYQITILSATESTGLQTWLDGHGYFLPAGSESMLSEYIEGGSYFLAARVADTATAADGSPLSPLQVSYDSDIFSIPIRLATLNSPGEQDMVIYAITDQDDGRVGIANYPEFDVPTGCVWGNPNTEDFSTFYNTLFSSNWETMGDAAWTVEFADQNNGCNPCTGTAPDATQLAALGFNAERGQQFLTRIHMRYTPEQANADLMFYPTMMRVSKVSSFADDFAYNYECVDHFCDGSLTRPDLDSGPHDTSNPGTPSEKETGSTCGCASSHGETSAALLLLGATALLRRRR